MGEALRTQLDQRCEGPYLRPELFSIIFVKPGSMNHANKMSRIILKIYADRDSSGYKETVPVETKLLC